MFASYEAEAAFALQAVKEAATLCRQIQHELVIEALSKEDRSPVTVADFASQALVAAMLQKVFPQATLVAEEGSAALREPHELARLNAVTGYVQSRLPGATADQVCDWIDLGDRQPGERYWTLDPIDGTKGFLRGDQYVVALALVERGRPVVGALGCPNLHPEGKTDVGGPGSLAIAVRGEGAWILGLESEERRRMQVSDCERPDCARMLRSFESAHTDPTKLKAIQANVGLQADPVLMDSQAKYVLLADGKGELIFRILSPHRPDYVEKVWDHAAGALIVTEAGGQVTDVRGKPLDFSQGRYLYQNLGVLASNGALHAAGLQALADAGANYRPEDA